MIVSNYIEIPPSSHIVVQINLKMPCAIYVLIFVLLTSGGQPVFLIVAVFTA